MHRLSLALIWLGVCAAIALPLFASAATLPTFAPFGGRVLTVVACAITPQIPGIYVTVASAPAGVAKSFIYSPLFGITFLKGAPIPSASILGLATQVPIPCFPFTAPLILEVGTGF